jgi:gamma-glutamyltranspeptidase / glutathione hydrolase
MNQKKGDPSMKKKRSLIRGIIFAAVLTMVAYHVIPQAANAFDSRGPIRGYSEVFSFTDRVTSEKGGVSCKSAEAASAGLEMLEKGGNAVDAIVASGLASTVTSAGMRTIAGYGGAMVIYLKRIGKPIVLDFNTYAPYDLDASMFSSVNDMNTASNVKTVLPWAPVAGLYTALKKYGTMSWEEVMQPAIRLAEEGYVLSADNASAINSNCGPGKKFSLSPASAAIYCPNPPYKAGDLFIQKDLAQSLKALVEKGPEEIYTGELAKKMVDYIRSIGGVITMKDLSGGRNPLVRIEEPAHTNYRGYDVYTSPICTGGENLIAILNILKGFDLGKSPSALSTHLIMEATKLSFADRFYYVTDPWIENSPICGLLSQGYADSRRPLISPSVVAPSYSNGNPWPYDNNLGPDFFLIPRSPFLLQREQEEWPAHKLPFDGEDTHPNTTSTSSVDRGGNMVAMTFTVNSTYGSGITVPGTGITLNDGLTGNKFSLDPKSLNYLVGGKLIVNNMNAYLILKDGNPIISNGAAGGRTIMTTCLNTIIHLLDFGMDIYNAMNSPRFHCEATESSCYFEKTYDATILNQLKSMGHTSAGTTVTSIGAQHGLQYDPRSGLATMAPDLRDDRSTAAGFQKKSHPKSH